MAKGSYTLHENCKLYVITPAVADFATLATEFFPVSDVIRLHAVFLIGESDAALIMLQVVQAQDAAGTNDKVLDKGESSLPVLLTSADKNSWVTVDIQIDAALIDLSNGYSHIALRAYATSTTLFAGVALCWTRSRPPTQSSDYIEQVVIAG